MLSESICKRVLGKETLSAWRAEVEGRHNASLDHLYTCGLAEEFKLSNCRETLTAILAKMLKDYNRKGGGGPKNNKKGGGGPQKNGKGRKA